MGLHPRIDPRLERPLQTVTQTLRRIAHERGSDAALGALGHFMMGLQGIMAEQLGYHTDAEWTDFSARIMAAMDMGMPEAEGIAEATEDYRRRLRADEGQSAADPANRNHPFTLIKGGQSHE